MAANTNRGTTASRRVPYSMESLFHTKPVSKRSSIVNNALDKPGIESLCANENAVSCAIDEFFFSVVCLLSFALQYCEVIYIFFFTVFIALQYLCSDDIIRHIILYSYYMSYNIDCQYISLITVVFRQNMVNCPH